MIEASIIIPTYNRCRSLKRTLESLRKLNFPLNKFEIVLVDNNSSDDTPKVAFHFRKLGLPIKYIKEGRLSFTVARHTGARIARGRVLLYIDDDVTVSKEWLKTATSAFAKNPRIGMIGGPIKPIYEKRPPKWVSRMNPIWLSLFDCGTKEKEISSVPGPNLAIRKSVLKEVGGFPPDTIGVESENQPGTIEKIYIGPGDGGLSQKVKNANYKIIYVPKALVYHHIPSVRLTKQWWHDRLIGEGCCHAIFFQHKDNLNRIQLFLKVLLSLRSAAKEMVFRCALGFLAKPATEFHEFQLSYHLSRMKTEWILARNPGLANHLWKIGLSGILPKNHKKLLKLMHKKR